MTREEAGKALTTTEIVKKLNEFLDIWAYLDTATKIEVLSKIRAKQ